MKVYLDVVFFLNFMFDLLLLLSVAIEQKRYPKKRRLFLGAFTGSISTFFLFLPLSNFTLLLLKLFVSCFMILASFGYPSKKRFFDYLKSLYGFSIILGGLIYALNLQFGYHQIGFFIFRDKTSLSFLLILLFSPLLFFLYVKGKRKEKKRLNLVHEVSIYYQGKHMIVEGYLDTGNVILDPYKKRPVLILSHQDFSPKIEDSLLVPFKTVGHKGLLRCVIADKILIDQKELVASQVLIGKSEEEVNLFGTKCIIPEEIVREE